MTRILWVWEDAPPVEWPKGYDQVLVKAFDGKATTGANGFHWGANLAQWTARFRDRNVGAWGVAYQGDGAELGPAVADLVRHAAYLVLDIEDWNGRGWSDAELHDVIRGVRTALPDMDLGYSSYPTRSQCQAHGINQQILDQYTDFGMPQVYFDYQAAQLAQVWADHKHAYVTVSPADYHNWDVLAAEVLQHATGIAFWRMGIGDWQDWADEVPGQHQPAPPPAPVVDPLRPAYGGAWPAGRFVAWDGRYWSLTDGIWWRPLDQGMAQGLVWDGVPVHLWPHCRVEAVQAK